MPRILHLGLGNFHRAHQAWYTAHAGGNWKITGVVMRNEALHDALRTDGGYALGIRGTDGLAAEWIDIHDRVILASRDAASVIDAFADPDLHVVTLTITEKGYCMSPRTGALDLDHPDIRADLAASTRATASGAMGLLAQGLSRRFEAGRAPLTIISCDNISGNGAKLAAAVAAFANAAGLKIDPGNRFPDTMVDRITPATTDETRSDLAAVTGRPGAQPVLTEAFSEWVIENSFAGPRPAWKNAGAEFVSDVAPFEMRKLRLLNASHSYLAYAGLLAGHQYIHDAIADPGLRAGVERLWDEAGATLPAAVSRSTPAYRAALIARFSVAEMRHPLAQIAMDGSLKLKERIVPLVKADGHAPQATEVIAAWIAFTADMHRQGNTLSDPNASEIVAALDQYPEPLALCSAMAGIIGLENETASGAWLDDLAKRVALHAK